VASAFERVVLTGAQMSGDVARQPRCGRVVLGWGRQKKGGGTRLQAPCLTSGLLRRRRCACPS
jgi:hypothetical protein